MTRFASIYATLLTLIALVGVRPAFAHDPTTALDLIWANESDELPTAIWANRGILFPTDDTFQMRCYAAYNVSSSQFASVTANSETELVISTFDGVRTTSDRACTFELATGLPNLSLSPAVELGGNLFTTSRTVSEQTSLYRSTDQGDTFSAVSPIPFGEYYDQLLVAPSDATRLYASVVRTTAGMREFACAMSQDSGSTWSSEVLDENVIPFAVDPVDAERVYAYQGVDAQLTRFRVLRSASGCSGFQPIVESDEGLMKPTALSGSGTTRWLGFADTGGLYRSDDGGDTFARAMSETVVTVSCFEQRGDRLWVCGTLAPNTRGIWYLDGEAAELTEYMTMADVSRPVACEAAAERALCAGDWYDFYQEENPMDAGVADAGAVNDPDAGAVSMSDAGSPDAGSPDAGPSNETPDSAAGEVAASSDGCGCRVGRGSSPWALGIAAMVMLGLVQRRRLHRRIS